MTAQPSLFDPPPRLSHRRSDPVTSKQAARSVDLAARKQEVIDAMRLIGTACTAHEIHEVLRSYGSRMDIGSVRSRLNDGRVRKVGIKTVPKPVGSGRPEQTWWFA